VTASTGIQLGGTAGRPGARVEEGDGVARGGGRALGGPGCCPGAGSQGDRQTVRPAA